MKPEHAIATAFCAGVLLLTGGTACAAAISGQGTWETTLLGRDLDGNRTTAEAYYDTMLDITWLADADFYGRFTDMPGHIEGSLLSWTTATTWAATLNPYGSGINGWRLPSVVDVNDDGCTVGVDCGTNFISHGELSHLWYVSLANSYSVDAANVVNAGPFSNIRYWYYWSGTEYAADPAAWAWNFDFEYGSQGWDMKSNANAVAWPVHSGDVGASVVPLPAAAWLFGTGLIMVCRCRYRPSCVLTAMLHRPRPSVQMISPLEHVITRRAAWQTGKWSVAS